MGVSTGMGLSIPTLSTGIMTSLPPARAGMGSGPSTAAREIGSALGVAIEASLRARNTTQPNNPEHEKIDEAKVYEKELLRLQAELVKLQEWVRAERSRIVVIFEGRDAAGKGSTIKRVTESLNPRVARIAALPAPTEREQTQWYFRPAKGPAPLTRRRSTTRSG